MLKPVRSRDDGDVIRARLRALLAEGQRARGWVPDDELSDQPSPATGWADDDLDRAEEPAEVPDVALPASLGRHRAPGRTTRLDPGRPGAWALWAVAVLAALAVVGWTWWDRPAVDQVPAASATAAQSTTTAPPPVPAPGSGPPGTPAGTVVVSVVGQVGAPGLVTLPAGARVADALAAAGGLLPEADPAAVNAAAVLGDGQQIAVGVPGAAAPAVGAPGAGVPGAAGAAGPVDLNTATAADLDALPGIGPVLAQRIVDHRTTNGPFTSVDQLDDVSGIGPAVFADLVDRVQV
ncbi:ComEA family DNA-binding protein [Modestobacter altitudinis]|uniref:ComEA family DNA-binding protein n=1 Tax=Modestobacter altitudinis TaxID=2213158 RepID=UPI00110CC325|nr:ComEA family DNA-binding protein [Modestobacter altitudinis]